MKHLTDEELLACRESDFPGEAAATKHLAQCSHCRAELEKLGAFLTSIEQVEVPEPDQDYEQKLWQELAPQLEKKPVVRRSWATPQRWQAMAATVALVTVAFFAGRATRQIETAAPATDIAQVRERVLLLAVGQHLGRSEMILVELANADAGAGTQLIDTPAEQLRAENLLEENRLYRTTAQQAGDAVLVDTLDELELVLQDIARSSPDVTPAQFKTLQERIESGGILFKVRLLGSKLRQQQEQPASSPTDNTV